MCLIYDTVFYYTVFLRLKRTANANLLEKYFDSTVNAQAIPKILQSISDLPKIKKSRLNKLNKIARLSNLFR